MRELWADCRNDIVVGFSDEKYSLRIYLKLLRIYTLGVDELTGMYYTKMW